MNGSLAPADRREIRVTPLTKGPKRRLATPNAWAGIAALIQRTSKPPSCTIRALLARWAQLVGGKVGDVWEHVDRQAAFAYPMAPMLAADDFRARETTRKP